MLLFHQNMRTFGGGSPGRNVAFNGGFAAINAQTGSQYLAAGFTEITNNLTSVIQLPPLAAVIDPGLTRLTVIQAGISALGLREYVGIAWDPNYLIVAHGGIVLKHGVTRRWTAYDTPAIGGVLPATINIAGGTNYTADSRGPGYIAGNVGGTRVIIMFFHNMYATGDRSSAFTALPSMADSIRSTIGGAYAGAEVFIGGDFNVAPRLPRRTRSRHGIHPLVVSAEEVAGVPINTTAANPYDFWLCSDNNYTNADDTVYTDTRIPLASDHAAIVLDLI